jgi:thiamine biosynthesis lipoprotein
MRHAEHVMGTVVSFDLRPGDLDERRVRTALAEACARLHEADEEFSTWKPDSALSRLRSGSLGPNEASERMADVLRSCAEARELSGGWFDPWSLPGGVDPTGFVKGWAAELALAQLKAAGLSAAMVNAGGDVATFGEPQPGRPWRVGVRDPRSADRLLTVVESPGAVATSGAYERGDQVLDPGSGRPARGLLSATVAGPALGLTDALATGLLAAGEQGLAALGSVEGHTALVLRDDGAMLATPGFRFSR